MFLPAGWSHADFAYEVERLRTGVHGFNYYATLLTLEDIHVTRLPPLLLGGGSKIDHILPGNSASIVVSDPRRTLTPYMGGNARKYLIRVYCEDPGSGLSAWPVGTFAVQAASWSVDGVATFTGVAKSMLAQFRPLEPYTVKKGTKVVDAVRQLMTAAGEADRLIHTPSLGQTLKHDVTVAPSAPDENPDTAPHTFMVVARLLASGLGFDLTYYPDGELWMVKPSTKPVFTFRDGDKGWITADGAPKATSQFADFHNVVTGLWGKDLKEKPVQVRPPAKHKLSPESLARRGVEYTEELVLQFPHARVRTVVYDQCRNRLRVELQESASVQASIEPFPFLVNGDHVAMSTDTWHQVFEPSWTLTLEPGAPMSLGWNRFAFLGPLR